MKVYNYKRHIEDDVLNFIDEEINFQDFGTIEKLEEYLNNELLYFDSVTGNASGSYFFNTWEAEEAICHNLELLERALYKFGDDGNYLFKRGAEAADATIRCYLLPECIAEVMVEIKEEFEKAHEEEEEEE